MIPWLTCRRAIYGTAVGLLTALVAGACDKVPLLAPTESTITLAASRLVLPVNHFTEIIATIIEQSGTPVHNGTVVTFTTTLGTIEPRETQTNSGKVTVLLHAGSQSGTAKVSAFSGDARAEEIEIAIAGAAAETIILNVSPGTLPSLGRGETVQVIAVVHDGSGNPLPGAPVTFTADAGLLSSGTVITDQNGEARTMLAIDRETIVTANAGAERASTTIRINTPPSITISATTSPTAGQPTTFTITVTTVSGASPVKEVTVDCGDGESMSLGTLTGSTTVTHVYDSSTTYTVVASATDNSGERTSVTSVIYVAPAPPLDVTIAVNTTSRKLNVPVSFTVSVSPTGIVIDRYEWNFGDGSSATTSGKSTSHTYTSAKAYVVTVTVVAQDGRTGTGRVEVGVE